MLCLSQEVAKGIFVSNALVKPNNGMVTISVLNSNNHNAYIKNGQLKFEAINNYHVIPIEDSNENLNQSDTNTSENENYNYNIKYLFCVQEETHPDSTESERLRKIKKLINIGEDLNSEEETSLMELVENYEDIFHLPGEQLSFTPSIQHRIPIKRDQPPINHKMYRLTENSEE